MEAVSCSWRFDSGVHPCLGGGGSDHHNDYHADNLDSRQYLYPQNDELQATKTMISILLLSLFLFSPNTYMLTSTTVPG